MRRDGGAPCDKYRHALYIKFTVVFQRAELMETKKPFIIRIDKALWSHLERWAADELRSVNGQIEYILRDAVSIRKGSQNKQEKPK